MVRFLKSIVAGEGAGPGGVGEGVGLALTTGEPWGVPLPGLAAGLALAVVEALFELLPPPQAASKPASTTTMIPITMERDRRTLCLLRMLWFNRIWMFSPTRRRPKRIGRTLSTLTQPANSGQFYQPSLSRT